MHLFNACELLMNILNFAIYTHLFNAMYGHAFIIFMHLFNAFEIWEK